MSTETKQTIKQLAFAIKNGGAPDTIVLGGGNKYGRHKDALIIENWDGCHKYIRGSYFLYEDCTNKDFLKYLIQCCGPHFKKIIADWQVTKDLTIDTELCKLYWQLLKKNGILCFTGGKQLNCMLTQWEDKEHDFKRFQGAKQILQSMMDEKTFLSCGVKVYHSNTIYHIDQIIQHNINIVKNAGFKVQHIMNTTSDKKIPYPLDDSHSRAKNSDLDYYIAIK